MKKIVLISNKVYHYRISVYNYFDRKLKAAGYELVVITNEVQKEQPHAVTFHLIVKPFNFNVYKREILKLKPDVVVLFLHMKNIIIWLLLPWLKSKKIMSIYWGHGVNLQTPNNVVKKMFFNGLHALADAIVLYSENEKKYIKRKYWNKLFVANNAINFSDIPDIAESKEEIKKEFNVNFEKIVLFVGRITKRKRFGDLIEASRFLNEGIGTLVVGDGVSLEQLKRIKKSSNIMYLGAIYDKVLINKIFKMSDVFCIPGTLGLGVNLAFYWELPIVTEDVCHSPEASYIKDGYNALIVPKADIHALADSKNLLLSDPEKYQDFSNAANKEIMEKGNIDVMFEGFWEAISNLKSEKD